MPTNATYDILQILLLAQHVSGTIMPIIRSSRVLYRWLLPVVFGALVFKFSVWCGAEGYVSGLRATDASNKICKKSSVASSWHFISTYYRPIVTVKFIRISECN